MSFLLTTALAQKLHLEICELPIVDYHTHLSAREMVEDRCFANLTELWLEADHYKWRLMRACGIHEDYVTGGASAKDKFLAFASAMPLALGNPVHQWAHMELRSVFGIECSIEPKNAEKIWEETEVQLKNLTVRSLLDRFRVAVVCTTDDPADDLRDHEQLAREGELETRVLPTYRPDSYMRVDAPEVFAKAILRLEQRIGREIHDFAGLVSALRERHDDFHALGCRMSDHGLSYLPTGQCSQETLEKIFSAARNGIAAELSEWECFAGELLRTVAKWNHQRGWTMQLHLGPHRNVNTVKFEKLGPDAGYDTMGSWGQTQPLLRWMDQLERVGALPKLLVYVLNPQEIEAITCALQNFQSPEALGKIQLGPAWWHCDHARGIRENLAVLASLSALGTHLGMLTDSRSFTSFVRHDFFRRILCQFLADQAQTGEMPGDFNTLKEMAVALSGANAESFLFQPSPSRTVSRFRSSNTAN